MRFFVKYFLPKKPCNVYLFRILNPVGFLQKNTDLGIFFHFLYATCLFFVIDVYLNKGVIICLIFHTDLPPSRTRP